MYLVTAREMQEMDRQTIEAYGIPGLVLMENAGRGATRMMLDLFPDIAGKRVGVVAGKGNNGGDGFVMARYLIRYGARPTVYLLARKEQVRGDAAVNLGLLEPLDVPIVELPDARAFQRHAVKLAHEQLWVDAILGTGLTSEVTGFFRTVIEFLNATRRPIFAVDIPSGLASETGRPMGAAVRATATATFAFPKIGCVIYPGAEFTGRLGVIDIGIPDHIRRSVGPRQSLLTPPAIRAAIMPRPADAHKGTNGHLAVLAGSTGKSGAAAMTAMAAMKVGSGLVTLGIPASLNAVLEALLVEVMTVPLPETETGSLAAKGLDAITTMMAGKTGMALGPGLGTGEATRRLIHNLLPRITVPTVIDADGLNLLAGHLDVLASIPAPLIVTPHPGEMARLAGVSVEAVQQDRIDCARRFAATTKAHVVLKGARTVVAHPDGSVFINSTGNAGMAAGGMGDVLTGVIAGLLVQGYAPDAAACIGVYWHGLAADRVAREHGAVGYVASQVLDALPATRRQLMHADGPPPDVPAVPEFRGV